MNRTFKRTVFVTMSLLSHLINLMHPFYEFHYRKKIPKHFNSGVFNREMRTCKFVVKI